MSKVITFNLNEENVKTLDEFQKKFNFNRSVIIRNVLNFFEKNPAELQKILINEFNLQEEELKNE